MGITERLFKDIAPELPWRLWSELDIIPMVFRQGKHDSAPSQHHQRVDEQADSMARKSVASFGPNLEPRVNIGFLNEVDVDSSGHTNLASLESYIKTVGEGTWNSVLAFAGSLKARKTKIAFFSSVPRGGGVALMRHALVRFLRLLEVDAKWSESFPRDS